MAVFVLLWGRLYLGLEAGDFVRFADASNYRSFMYADDLKSFENKNEIVNFFYY